MTTPAAFLQRARRIVVKVGIAYGSDVERALKLLNDVVRAHPHTLKEPSPVMAFENFGGNWEVSTGVSLPPGLLTIYPAA